MIMSRMIQKINRILDKELVPESEYIFGCADLTGLLDKKINGFSYGISKGLMLNMRFCLPCW